ncbi:hypothetical protein F511_33256 [Dorcoceras hygrometricum]|uniref:Uncharacterized protein n=1 Tax=Dorcoceras hygrometricum TaxID=472368 RepID=A0A2Z7AMH8_9LAMI|nr:hypothetical protein F511_33256 [Dorcoceras hygrometricum]
MVEISEEWFAEYFELPVDGLGDLSEIPKDAIFDARSIVSLSVEPVSLSGRKNQMKFEFRLLCDIMAKAISVKAGSFNAITVEKFSLITAVVRIIRMNWAKILFSIFKRMVTPGSKQAKGFAIQISLLLANIPNLELGASSEFPTSKILTKKTVHRFVSINDRDGAEEATGAIMQRAASKKRPAVDVVAAGSPGDRGAVIARTNMNTRSSCWIRTMLYVNGEWIVEPCADRWVKIPQMVISNEVHRHRKYDDTLPSFFKLLLDSLQFLHSESLSFAPCSLISVCLIGYQVQIFQIFLSSIALERTALRSVQRSFAESVIPSVQLSLDQRQSFSSSTDSSSSLHFDVSDVDATASSLPPVFQDFSADLADLQAILSEQIYESQSGISSKLHKIEQGFRDSLNEQAAVVKKLFQKACQEGRSMDDVQTLRFNEFRKNILAQNASIFVGLADVRKEVQEVNAKVDIMASRLNDIQKDAEATKEALSHQLFEFQMLTKMGKVAAEDPNRLRMCKSKAVLNISVSVLLLRSTKRQRSSNLERSRWDAQLLISRYYLEVIISRYILEEIRSCSVYSLEIAKRQRLDKLKRQRIDWLSISAYGYSELQSADDVNQQAQAHIDSNTIVYSNGKDLRDEEDNERTVDRSKDKSKDKFKETSNDRRMKTSSNKIFSRKHDRKVLVAEESTKSWADSDSDSSSSSSSSSDSEQEEVRCFMADQTADDEVFDFSNVEFTRDDLVIALNDMVKEYRKLSHSFEEAKSEKHESQE